MDVAAATERIRQLSLAETTIQLAEPVPVGPFRLPAPPQASPELPPTVVELPAHGRVRAVVAPQITIELWLPLHDDWNGRFQGVGGGGLAGSISYAALADALRAGYATASTDTGHVGSTDARWAIGRPDLVADYGYRAVHEMTLKARAIVEAFYGQPPRFSYFTGCSTGGRQGLMEAQRFPEDYDGVLAGAPAIGISVFHAAQLWAARQTLLDPAAFIRPEQYAAVTRSLLEQWDALDGVVDGLIDDPRRVRVDFAAVQRAADLSDRQVQTLRALYAGPVNAAGESIYPGLMPGGETLWQPVVGGPEPLFLGPAIYGQMVFEQADWDWRTFDYDADLAAARARLGPVMDALDPDLRPFQARGGKIILYHGWSDFGISPEATRRYYEQVTDTCGGRAATQTFARLFLLPGVGHCRGGSGPDTFDGLGPLVDWVEHQRPPQRLIATQSVDGRLVRSRPLCPYPQVARYTGQGSIDDAASFVCQEPPPEPHPRATTGSRAEHA